MKRGDCYVASGCRILDPFATLPEGAVLVHGRPTLTRPPFEPFGHAWLEFTTPEGVPVVWDVANGSDHKHPAFLYYAVGNIDPTESYRYSGEEARAMVLEHEHWGPWEGIEAETD